MKTVIYRLEADPTRWPSLAPHDQKFLKAVTVEGIDVPSLIKALGKPVKTHQQRMAFYGSLQRLKQKGLVKTKTFGLSVAA